MHDVERENKKEKTWTVMRKGRGRKRGREEGARGKKKGKDKTDKRKKMKRRKKRTAGKKQMGEEGSVRKGTHNQDPRIKTLNFRKRRITNYEKGTIKKMHRSNQLPYQFLVTVT